MPDLKIEKPYYPIVYVRGYAMTPSERQDTFNDTYYGFSATSVEKREAPPPRHFEVDVFEGQLIRLMKMKKYGYADSANTGLQDFSGNPSRSLWVCRFYDEDQHSKETRKIPEHAEDLRKRIHRLVTLGTPHKGIDLGRVPDFIENMATSWLNVFGSEIFEAGHMLRVSAPPPGRMRSPQPG